MSNITMTIDDQLLKKARKLALEKNTSLTSLIRRFLKTLVMKEERNKEDSLARLQKIWGSGQCVVGPVHWTRDDLHDR